MDIEYIKEKIYNLDEKRKIQPGEYLSAEVIELLRQGNTNSRVTCFSKTADVSPSKNKCLFPAELVCSHCNNITVQNISKTNLFNYLQGRSEIVCDDCRNEIKSKKESYATRKQKYQEEIKQATEQYIKNYLDPEKTLDKSLSPKERTYLIIAKKDNVDYKIVSKYINSLSYQDFLNTPYWHVISEYKKFKSNYKCAICGGNIKLATHHSSYKRHGKEHEYVVIDEDLIVLCQDCHDKFHDKL